MVMLFAQADCCVKMLFLLQFFYGTVTSRSWLTCLEVDGNDVAALMSTESCQWQVMVTVFVAFFVVLIHPFYRDFM
jgi:hypothetical protein